MMTADTLAHKPSFAFFSTGASFACEVLAALQYLGFYPELLVLPEYSPAAKPASSSLLHIGNTAQRRLLQLAANIDIAYAPQAQQEQCARLLHQRAIEFMLVACWPYLIEERVTRSVIKGALNLHPSLLPRYPGADPIGEQLKDGARQHGVSLHLLSPNFDRGDIVAQAELREPLPPPERTRIERDCARLGSALFIDALNGYDAGWRVTPQQPPGTVAGQG
jgi:methionyl-tRNA formyltransferase